MKKYWTLGLREEEDEEEVNKNEKENTGMDKSVAVLDKDKDERMKIWSRNRVRRVAGEEWEDERVDK